MALPTLDLTTLVAHPDWDAVFGFPGTLELEVGAGKGGFAAGYGVKHPERRLVALEQRRVYAEETRRRVEKSEVKNVLVLQADAKVLAPKLFMPASLDAIHVYFPDPWWKRRHFKRRVVDPAFSRTMLELLKPGAPLHVRTDVEERAVDMLAVLSAAGFVNPRMEAPRSGHPTGLRPEVVNPRMEAPRSGHPTGLRPEVVNPRMEAPRSGHPTGLRPEVVNPFGEAFAPFDPEEVPTTRERRYLASGQQVWRLHMVRPR